MTSSDFRNRTPSLDFVSKYVRAELCWNQRFENRFELMEIRCVCHSKVHALLHRHLPLGYFVPLQPYGAKCKTKRTEGTLRERQHSAGCGSRHCESSVKRVKFRSRRFQVLCSIRGFSSVREAPNVSDWDRNHVALDESCGCVLRCKLREAKNPTFPTQQEPSQERPQW
jgi:hypothetical protein